MPTWIVKRKHLMEPWSLRGDLKAVRFTAEGVYTMDRNRLVRYPAQVEDCGPDEELALDAKAVALLCKGYRNGENVTVKKVEEHGHLSGYSGQLIGILPELNIEQVSPLLSGVRQCFPPGEGYIRVLLDAKYLAAASRLGTAIEIVVHMREESGRAHPVVIHGREKIEDQNRDTRNGCIALIMPRRCAEEEEARELARQAGMLREEA